MNPTPAALPGLNSRDVAKGVPEDSDSPGTSHAGPTFLPGVFLMTDSFETGGSERQFVELARSLNPANYKVSLGCLQPQGPFRKDVGTVEHFNLGGSLYRLQSMHTRWRLAARLRSSNVAIAHAFDFYTNLTLIPAAKLARTPVVIGSLRQLGDLLTPLQRRAQLMVFRWADCVICNSQAAADNLLQRGFRPDRLAVIGNGLPLSAFAEALPVVPRRPGIFRVGMIARMNTRSKNHRILLEATARLLNRIGNIEIVLVGDGPFRAELERQAKDLGINEVVQFLGNRRDVQAILASLDVTVLPSASESLSNAILESMAAGVPVIANHVGGNIELLSNDRGILLPPDGVEALAAALQKVAGDVSMRESLGRSAKEFALQNFTVERMRKKHEELYARLLEKKGWCSSASADRNDCGMCKGTR